MSVDELRAGMRGYGLTVFSGMRPERFEVEVVGTLRNFRPQQDLVLIRTTHPILAHANTVGGMSGSPIYIEDKLVGAYAYGWEFGNEPIAGVTPIANMLNELRRVRRTPAGMIPGSSAPLPIAGPSASAGAVGSVGHTLNALTTRRQASRAPIATAHGSLQPLAVPFAVAGFSQGGLRFLAEGLEPLGLVPLQAAGTGTPGVIPAGTPEHFEPGGSVSVQLVSGDISGAGTGTVTWVHGDDVLGFGHPMLELGEVALPTALSRVSWILSSSRRSFKIAEPVRPLGALVQDRPSTIIVSERGQAPTVPIRVQIQGNDPSAHNTWNVRVAYHRTLFSRLVGGAVITALETAAGDTTDAGYTLEARVHTRDHGVLRFSDVGVVTGGPSSLSPLNMSFFEGIERLTDNAFQPVRVDRVEVDVALRWQREFYYVRNVALSQAEADVGQTVQVMVSLGVHAGRPVTRMIPLRITREMAGRELEIELSSGKEAVPDMAEPEDIDDLIRNLTTSYPNDALVMSVRMPGQAAVIRGRALYNLPASAMDALRPAASTDGAEALINAQHTVIPMGRFMIGRDRVRLRVRDLHD